MLMSLLKPEKWTGVKGDAFESELLDWELDTQRYEHQTGKKFDDDDKVATVMRWGPEEIRGSLLTGDPRNRDSYPNARSAILMMIRGKAVFNSRGVASGSAASTTDSDAMQIDASGKGTKGKKGKGKGKDKTKDGMKGKFGKNSKGGAKFNGYCNCCKKWGHKQAQCWTTAAAPAQVDAAGQKEDPTAATKATAKPSTAGGVSQVQSCMPSHGNCRMCGFDVTEHTAQIIKDDMFHIECAECIEQDSMMLPIPETDQTENYVMAVQSIGTSMVAAYSDYSLEPGETWLLWDTGADSHPCRKGLAKNGRPTGAHGPRLTDVQNNPIKDFGAVKVEYHCDNTDGEEVKCETDFQVAEVNENVMSAGNVIRRKAFRAVLDSDGSYLELKTHPKVCVPLYLTKNSFHLRAKVRSSDSGESLLAAPVIQTGDRQPDQPMGDAEAEDVKDKELGQEIEVQEEMPIEELKGDDVSAQEIGREW